MDLWGRISETLVYTMDLWGCISETLVCKLDFWGCISWGYTPGLVGNSLGSVVNTLGLLVLEEMYPSRADRARLWLDRRGVDWALAVALVSTGTGVVTRYTPTLRLLTSVTRTRDNSHCFATAQSMSHVFVCMPKAESRTFKHSDEVFQVLFGDGVGARGTKHGEAYALKSAKQPLQGWDGMERVMCRVLLRHSTSEVPVLSSTNSGCCMVSHRMFT